MANFAPDMEKSKILVTGAGGQLGIELSMLAALYPQFDFVFLSKIDLSIQDSGAVLQTLENHRPDYCINCAAYTAVDKAEGEKELAMAINGEATGILASACQSVQTKLIHISTDYVFDGNSSAPLKETDPTNPVNWYGASKLKGEALALEHQPETIIIRTSWLYSEFGNNFVKTMIRLMGEKESIRVVNDQLGSPTYAADLAKVILQVIGSGKFVPGIYHYSNEGRISWYEFAKAIKEMIQSPCRVEAISTSEYPTAARRPHFSLLENEKIRRVYAVETRDWKKSLGDCLGKINK
jgi:dTDP-4-dehydrorhamnose reductase